MSKYNEEPTVAEIEEDLAYFDKIGRADLKQRYIRVVAGLHKKANYNGKIVKA